MAFRVIFLCILVFGVYVFMYTTCVPGAHGDWKRALDSLELELQVLVIRQVGAGN